ncbi:histidine kinase [Phenylobacterium sp.]|uniref:sensor histidine kinase n=1 Tax=Phenylobacterium sp. TaxID=1871053 RepID=UPI00301CA4BE
MDGGRLFSVRGERIIAFGRAILAAFLCLSLVVGHVADDAIVRGLIVGYLAYSLLMLAGTRSRLFVYGVLRRPWLTSGLDFAIFTILLFLTNGAESPFFSPFIFMILSATLQWGSRGAVVMGGLTLAAFVATSLGSLQSQTQIFVLRIGYTTVITIMMAAFGGHLERVVQELSRLSDPIGPDAEDSESPLADALRHALRVFGARRGMALLESEEPYAQLLLLGDGELDSRRLPPTPDGWVLGEAADGVFLYEAGAGVTLVRSGRWTYAGAAQPLAEALSEVAPFQRVLAIPARSRGLSAWLFVLDHHEPANEDLAIGEMVGAQASMALERWEAQREQQAAAAVEDRIRLARDLHDGVLQFLAGAGLQLDALDRMPDLPDAVRARLATLRQAIVDEQRELRGFISAMRPTSRGGHPATGPLKAELDALAERLSRYWSIEVSAGAEPPDAMAPEPLLYDLRWIVREAVANAVRHGQADHVRIEARADGRTLDLTIQDNGRGFARNPAEPPRSLHERARALGGRLVVQNDPGGCRLVVHAPLDLAS